jgi:DNA (cytosine-5)-methyltransferase 3A
MPRSGNPKQGGTGHLSRNDGKPYCLDTGNTNAIEIVAMRGRGEKGNIEQQLEARKDGKTNCLTSVQKDNLIRQLNPSLESGGKQPYQQNRVYDIDGISPALQAQLPHGSNIINTSRIRRLTPIECERLQTVADNYTNHVSDSQRYKMLGNGWTIDVIAHILNYAF